MYLLFSFWWDDKVVELMTKSGSYTRVFIILLWSLPYHCRTLLYQVGLQHTILMILFHVNNYKVTCVILPILGHNKWIMILIMLLSLNLEIIPSTHLSYVIETGYFIVRNTLFRQSLYYLLSTAVTRTSLINLKLSIKTCRRSWKKHRTLNARKCTPIMY